MHCKFVHVLLFVLPLLWANTTFAQAGPAHEQFVFAYQLLQRGEHRLAAEEFDAYLGNFPNDEKRGDGLYYRAMLHRRAGDQEAAAELLADVPEPTIVPGYAVDLLRGQVLADLGEYAAALEALERVDAVDDLEPEVATSWRYLRGRAYRGTGNLQAAQAQFARVAEADSPLRTKALIDLARVQVLREREDEARETLRQALEVTSGDDAAEAARLAGDLSYRQRDYEQAVRFYDHVIAGHQNTSHFGPAVVGVLRAHHAAGRHRQVVEAFEELHELVPAEHRVPARYLAGSAYHELNEHEQAVRWLAAVAYGEGKHEQLEAALFKLAVSKQQLGDVAELQRALDRLREQYPDSPRLVDAAYLLASVEAEAGDVSRGAARLTELIEQGEDHPYHRAALLRRARLYDDHDRPAAAADDFGRYVELAWAVDDDSERTQQAALRQIDLLHRLNQHEQAEAAAARLLERESISASTEQQALYRRALAQVRLGEAEAALASLEALDERHPLHPFASPTRYYRGLLLTSLGRGDAAAEALGAAADDDALDRSLRANALRLLALHLRDVGKTDDARAALQRLESIAGQGRLNERERLWLARDAVEHDEAERALAYLAPLLPDDAGEARGGSSPERRAEAAYLAGRAHRKQGDAERALHLFSYIIALGHGYDDEARLERARTLADAGQLDDALSEYTSAARSNDTAQIVTALYESALVHRRRAAEQRRRGNEASASESNDQASRQLKRITLLYAFEELAPLPQLAHLELAEIARERDERPAVIAALEELLARFPAGAPARLARSMLAYEQERRDEARRLLRELHDDRAALDARLAERVQQWRDRVGG